MPNDKCSDAMAQVNLLDIFGDIGTLGKDPAPAEKKTPPSGGVWDWLIVAVGYLGRPSHQ